MENTKNLQEFLEHPQKNMSVGGCLLGQKLFLSACLKEFFVYITNSSEKMDEISQFLQTLSRKPCTLPYIDEPLSYSLSLQTKRNEVMSQLYQKDCDCLIIDIRNLMFKFPSLAKYEKFVKTLSVGQEYDRNDLQLEPLGYQRVNKVEKMGQYAIRGDIVDIYATSKSVRISFFDTEIESIKEMDFESNVSIQSLNDFSLTPNTFVFDSDIAILAKELENLKNDISPDASANFASTKSMLQDRLNDLAHISSFIYLNYAINGTNILDLLQNCVVILDEPQMIEDSLSNHFENLNNEILNLTNAGQLYENFERNYFAKDDILNAIKKREIISFDNFNQKPNIIFDVSATQNYKNKPELLIYDLKNLIDENFSIMIFSASEIDRSFLADILNKNLINFEVLNDIDRTFSSGIKIINKPLPMGCILKNEKIALLNYGNYKGIKKIKQNENKPFFELPQEGDYVVHDFHGIGLCLGIQKLKISGFTRDYIVIKYEGADKLYLPVENADSITKYIGQEQPKLNKIGGAEFERAKKRVREQLEFLATDMLKIYAEREKTKGHIYNVDTFIQNQFENAFVYEETPDQLKAISDIKKDMSSTKIMDRLICGDVGYGKTEVAFRAAMIAIDNNKQVVLLAPTTILTEQHYKSAMARFQGFGVKIAVLNRFKTPKEQKEIFDRLQNGDIDLLIGTQKVLSDKIEYKNLGLLILDEEQKLGVKDKEKIKKLKHNIDVLSMSATPIPRTLHMSLVGIRDISTIATAPQMRKSVQTTICEYNDALIKTVVDRELERGGQILIVKNRVEGLSDYVYKLQQLLPYAKIAYAHGQMDKNKLEATMKDVFDCNTDILVATTLIENGIDLPNANTMIIINADKFGLSALYQLRGRVGRGSSQAYAYFTFDDFRSLTQEGAKRLQAMQEFTDLGSGFKIAMRDLELRGAGTVLGEKQSGHLEKVGYDMYCKLLEQVIMQLKGEEKKSISDLRIDIDIQAEIPNYYISDNEIKMEVIDRISKISNGDNLESEISKLSAEFGKLPLQTLNLAKIATLKNIFKLYGASSIIMKLNGKNQIEFPTKPNLTRGILRMGDLVEELGKFVLKLNKTDNIIGEIDELINIS